MATKDNRPGTLVSIQTPKEEVPLSLRDIAVGAYFGINNDANVYVKTDEIMGRGYKCFRVKDGHLVSFEAGIIIAKTYPAIKVIVN